MRPWALVLLAAAFSSCGGSSSDTARTELCVDRLLQRATPQDVDEDEARRYVRDTYCDRFERNGWIYDDGVLSIRAHTWLEESGSCATARAGEPPRTVPCDLLEDPDTRRLDCALLHHVRRSEVRDYIERLRRERPVECDDGTPVDHLGVGVP